MSTPILLSKIAILVTGDPITSIACYQPITEPYLRCLFAYWHAPYNLAVIPSRSVAIWILIVSITSIGLPGPAVAQSGASRVVLASVTDAQSRPLTNLSEDDFVVREGGSPREVFAVRLADYPIAVLLDNGPGADFDAVRRSATRFIARIGRDRPVVIGALATPQVLLTTFDDDRARVNAALDALQPEPQGRPLFLAGIARATALIGATQSPFAAVVVISATDPGAPADAGVELMAPIIDSRAAVHVVARAAAGGAGDPAGTAGAALRDVSAQTRGQFTAIYSAASYQSAVDRLADRLSAEMMIEFIEPPDGARSDDVKVGVRVPGSQVRGLGVSR